jgi:hypothetical protein
LCFGGGSDPGFQEVADLGEHWTGYHQRAGMPLQQVKTDCVGSIGLVENGDQWPVSQMIILPGDRARLAECPRSVQQDPVRHP